MSELVSEAVSVAQGACPPAHSAAVYIDASLDWATSQAQPGESQEVALARLCAAGSVVIGACYRAAAIASLLDDLDITDLVPNDAPDAETRRLAWAGLLRLIEPHALPNELLAATFRRVLSENLAVRAMYLLLLQEPNQ